MGSGTAACDTSWHQMNVKYTSSNVNFRLDRATDTTVTPNSATLTTDDSKMWSNAGSEVFNGEIAEFIYYSAALSSTDITSVENYLNTRYGL